MHKVEYSDFYKFIVSVGISIAVLALLLPWLLFRDLDRFIEKVAVNGSVSDTANMLLSVREATALHVAGCMCIVSFFGMIAGAMLVVWGAKQWYHRQRLMDYRYDLETDTLAQQIPSVSDEDVRQEISEDISEETAEIEANGRVEDIISTDDLVANVSQQIIDEISDEPPKVEVESEVVEAEAVSSDELVEHSTHEDLTATIAAPQDSEDKGGTYIDNPFTTRRSTDIPDPFLKFGRQFSKQFNDYLQLQERLKIRSLLVTQFQEVLGHDYRVLADKRFGAQRADIVLLGRSPLRRDYTLEVGQMEDKYSQDKMRRLLAAAANARDVSFSKYQRLLHPVVIIVVPRSHQHRIASILRLIAEQERTSLGWIKTSVVAKEDLLQGLSRQHLISILSVDREAKTS